MSHMPIVSAAHLFVALALNLPVTFHRQKVFGQYIVDFYCASARIAIEVDGSQYFSEEGEQKDGLRDCYCAERGVKVLRYFNLQIAEDFEGVCQDILREIEERRRT